ncbi:MAG: ABC transporter permease [Candidatus Woesearchaeota archaeon]
MNLKESILMAVNNLLHRRLRSWLTLIGIFAGIAAIVALVSLGEGLEDAVTEQFAMMGVDAFTVQGAGSNFGPPGSNAAGRVGEDDVRLLEDIPGMKLAMGRFIQGTSITSRGESTQGFAFSMPEGRKEYEQAIKQFGLEAKEGRITGYEDHNLVTLGSNIKFDERMPDIGEKVTIKERDFRVAGILEKTGVPFVDNDILMSEERMIDLYNLSEDDYSLITAVVRNEDNLLQIKEIAEREMRRDRNLDPGEEDFTISTPQDTLESFQSVLNIVQVLLVGIAAISLLVGSINIANTMYTSVLERRRDIGIMKAIGARNPDVLRIFLIESGMLGMAGGVIGIVLGAGISKTVETIAQAQLGTDILQASFPLSLLIGALLFAFILGAASGTLPARQAAKMDPVEALRT